MIRLRAIAGFAALAACAAALAASAQNAEPPLKRFWVDESAGVSIAFPVDHPTLGFTREIVPEDPSMLVLMRSVPLSQTEGGASVKMGDAVCVARRRFADQGADLLKQLVEAAAAPDGGQAFGRNRCEALIYLSDVADKTFYGVQLHKTETGQAETCVAAYDTGESEYPYIVTQQTLFAVGDHGYDLSCSITVQDKDKADLLWTENARVFLAIRDSIARTPAD